MDFWKYGIESSGGMLIIAKLQNFYEETTYYNMVSYFNKLMCVHFF